MINAHPHTSLRYHRPATAAMTIPWLSFGFQRPHRPDFELFWSAAATAAGLGCLSHWVCAVNPKNIVRVFGRCRPTKPRPCGWVADKSLLIDSRNPVWFWRTDWILLLSPTHHILSAVSPAPWLEMTVNLSKIVPGVPLQWQWCSLAEIKYLCWPVLRMWDAVMNIIHLDYCTSTCHSIHIILAVYCISKYICMSTCTLSWYQSSSRLCQYSSTSHNLMFCLLQTH